MLTVNEMMTRKPHTLLSTHTLQDAKKLMEDKGIRHIPILSKTGKIEGLVTQRDILSAQNSTFEKNISNDDLMKSHLSRFIERPISTINSMAGLKTAAIYMQKNKIGCLPVVDDKALVGIITDSDFVSIAINLLEIQEEVEPMDWDE